MGEAQRSAQHILSATSPTPSLSSTPPATSPLMTTNPSTERENLDKTLDVKTVVSNEEACIERGEVCCLKGDQAVVSGQVGVVDRPSDALLIPYMS